MNREITFAGKPKGNGHQRDVLEGALTRAAHRNDTSSVLRIATLLESRYAVPVVASLLALALFGVAHS